MSQCLRLPHPLHLKLISIRSKKPTQHFMLCVRNCSVNPENARRLVAAVKVKLEKEYSSLPVGKNGRDDEEMILWFLKDRRFSVDDTVSKLTKAIRWRHEFGVSELSEESVKRVVESGKAYVHDYLDVYDRPVLIVDVSKHFPGFDAFYCYYPRRLGQVLFVDAPFIFKPVWQLIKPLLKSYASLVKFCSADDVRKEYFAEDKVPANFRD
ncbi:uncharacterized protein [Primulina huaijiensis]|uniref:uncharacterized protein isoform X3 n=1 Tax=Primulina huaijiensis TaxID=1492673 RepID=UPI003CC7187C